MNFLTFIFLSFKLPFNTFEIYRSSNWIWMNSYWFYLKATNDNETLWGSLSLSLIKSSCVWYNRITHQSILLFLEFHRIAEWYRNKTAENYYFLSFLARITFSDLYRYFNLEKDYLKPPLWMKEVDSIQFLLLFYFILFLFLLLFYVFV